MKTIDRRRLVNGILFGAAAAGLGLAPAAAMPLDDGVPGTLDDWNDWIQKTQWGWGPGPRRWRRRRVWRCWWRRGRRVCGWVWV